MNTTHPPLPLRSCALLPILAAIVLPHPTPAQQPGEKKISDAKLERIHRNNRRKAEEMWARDSRGVSPREMAEMERTYQVANANPRTPEAIEALKTVLEKFPKSNRAGCAALYLGRWTQGEDREKYLKLAIGDYSKCYYLDGTSVGGFSRFVLGSMYKQSGKEAEATKLFDELRKDYPEAQEHSGSLLVEQLPK